MRRFLFLLSVIFSAFLLSCSKETPLQPNEAEETVYQKVGRMHNEGLDYVLNYIKQNKGTIMTRSGQLLSKDDILSMVEPAVKEFIKMSSESGRFGPATRVSDGDLSLDYSVSNISEIRESLNDADKNYYDRCISIIESDEECNRKLILLSGLVSEINDDKSLDQQSKEALLYLVEVGSSSLKYWTEKIHEWYLALHSSDTPWTRANDYHFYAQGKVVNEYTQSMKDVRVCTLGYYLMTFTDSNGEFGLYIMDRDILVISADEYETANVEASVFRHPEKPTIMLKKASGGNSSGTGSIVLVDASTALGTFFIEGPNYYAIGSTALSASLIAAIGYVMGGFASIE